MKIVIKKRLLFWYITIQARNGETVLTSETYFSRANAQRAAERLSAETKLKIA